VSGHGHRAALPAGGHSRPEYLAGDEKGALAVRHYNREGRVREYDFTALPVPAAMQASLAALFAARCTPDRWSVHATSRRTWIYLRQFAGFLDGLRQQPRDLDELTPELIRLWRESLSEAGGAAAFKDAGQPVVLPHLATSLHAHLNGRYADPVWPLASLTENPSQSKKTIRWALWPAPLRDEMRLAAWNLINGQLRPTFLQGHSSGMRSRLSLSDTYSTAAQWKQFARWLAGRGTGTLAECSTSVLHDYGRHLRDSGRGRGPVLKSLVALTRLWAFDQLSAPGLAL
jgi:hypothetical protein